MAFRPRPGKCLLYPILRERKITPQEFSDRIGMPLQQLSDYANKRRVMMLPTAKWIANELGLPIDDLYEWLPTTSRRQSRRKTE